MTAAEERIFDEALRLRERKAAATPNGFRFQTYFRERQRPGPRWDLRWREPRPKGTP